MSHLLNQSDIDSVSLKSQESLMANWDSIDSPKVSIFCFAYNHGPYIETALKSLLMQEGRFGFEILVTDDASTDETAQIIQKYHQAYPKIIKPIYQTENQYSKRYSANPELNLKRAKGEYIAVCEGDDYWLSPQKLSKQVALMDQNYEFDLCFHSAIRVNIANGHQEEIIGCYREQDGVVPLESILYRLHGMIPTGACLLRNTIIQPLLDFYESNLELSQQDVYFQYLAAHDKGALFIDEPLSVYRFQSTGSWTEQFTQDNKFQTQIYTHALKANLYVDLVFKHQYCSIFKDLNTDLLFRLMLSSNLEDERIQLMAKFLFASLFKQLKQQLQQLKANSVYLYSTSLVSGLFLDALPELNICAVIDADSSKDGTLFKGYSVIHPSKLSLQAQRLPICIPILDRKPMIEQTLCDQFAVEPWQFLTLSLSTEVYNQALCCIHPEWYQSDGFSLCEEKDL